MSFLSLANLEKTYPDGTRAVKGLDLSVDAGEFIVLLGPSGCGKTTTLRMIAGLELPTGGAIQMDGRDVTRLRPSERDVGFVFQFYALYPHLSVRENIAFPLKSVGMPRAQRDKVLHDTAERLGLTNLLNRYPRQLSGGDQQRVSLARAMVRRPSVWLMDEPLGTLDADRRLEMREFIRRQQLEQKVTTIYVTHDQEEAMSLADRVVVMNGGLIEQTGAPDEVYDHPASLFVANFVGSPGMNFIKGRVQDGGASTLLPHSPGSPPIALPRAIRSGATTLGVRCEHVRVDAAGSIEGRVVVDEFLGASRSTHVETGFGRLIVRSGADDAHGIGQTVRLSFDPTHVRLFDADTGRKL